MAFGTLDKDFIAENQHLLDEGEEKAPTPRKLETPREDEEFFYEDRKRSKTSTRQASARQKSSKRTHKQLEARKLEESESKSTLLHPEPSPRSKVSTILSSASD